MGAEPTTKDALPNAGVPLQTTDRCLSHGATCERLWQGPRVDCYFFAHGVKQFPDKHEALRRREFTLYTDDKTCLAKFADERFAAFAEDFNTLGV